jgi:hypothetical protein
MSEQAREREDWRARVEELINRLEHDADYRAQIEADPSGELSRLGLPGPVQYDILSGLEANKNCMVTCTRGTSGCTKSAYT